MKKSRSNSRKHSRAKPRRRFGAVILTFCGGLLLLVGIAAAGWIWHLNNVVVAKFEGHKWAIPTRVYAQPLTLFAGQGLTPAELASELDELGYRRVDSVSGPGQFAVRGQAIEVHNRGFGFWDKDEPARQVRVLFSGQEIRQLQVLKGAATDLVRLEPRTIGAISPRHSENRRPVKLNEVSPLLGETLLAVEDRDFLDHSGVSLRAIARAMFVNVQAGRVVQGGSTLTQQLIKNFYLSNERSLLRKVQEALMSLLLEWHYSKAEIFETYINEVYLGQSGPHGVHGFGLAAEHYFDKPVTELSVSETALLVGLVKGASYYNPWRRPERASERRNLVIGVMEAQGLISPAEAVAARATPLGVVPESRHKLNQFPAYLDLVRRQLRQNYSDDDLSNEGLKVFTAFSPRVQRAAEKAVASRLERIERDYKLPAKGLQAGLVVTSVGSGELVAVVGDRNGRFSGFNRALDAHRPIGSLVKPAVFLAAMESGHYNWASLVSDQPVTVQGTDGVLWQPKNYNRESHGDVLMIDALAHSYNQSTARLGMQVGLDKVQSVIGRLGGQTLLGDADLDDIVQPYPAMLLGATSMSPLQVSAMYHTLANDGVAVPLQAIRAVTDPRGRLLNRYPLQIRPAIDPAKAYLMQYGLQAVMERGTGRAAYQRLPAGLAMGGKTGTTDDLRDSWFAGFTDEYVAVAWVGRDDNGKTPLTGATGALPVWLDLMTAIPVHSFQAQADADIVARWINPVSGQLTDEGCPQAMLLPFELGYMPTEHVGCDLDSGGGWNWFKRIW